MVNYTFCITGTKTYMDTTTAGIVYRNGGPPTVGPKSTKYAKTVQKKLSLTSKED